VAVFLINNPLIASKRYNISMPKPFIHLHTHSHYSLLTALPKIDDLVRTAQSDGMNSLALTDNGNLYGAIEFYERCRKAEIKPIIGVDFYVALRTRHDKEARIDNKRARLVLLAKNEEGYKNLIQLVTKSHIEGFYYKPRIDHELIEDLSEGLIAIIPSFSGETSLKLKEGSQKEAIEKINFYKEVFKNDLYLELTHHPEIEGYGKLEQDIVALSKKTNVPLVAAHDVYYIKPEDKEARNVLVKIQNTTTSDSGLGGEEDFSFIKTHRANEIFKEHPEALENTKKIADQCNLWKRAERRTATHCLRRNKEQGVKRNS
jgi:DNA polymerase-3 subunit alpha